MNMESSEIWSLKTISLKAIYTSLEKILFQKNKQKQDSSKLLKRNLEKKINKRRQLENVDHVDLMNTYKKKNKEIDFNQTEGKNILPLMNPELMFEVPEDIDNWIAVLCPDGIRCYVVAKNNKTKAIATSGKTINCFQSLFPYGQCLQDNRIRSRRIQTVLDCVYSAQLRKFYVLDVLEWLDMPCTYYDADFRFSFVESRLNLIQGINKVSEKNYFPFEMAPRMVTSDFYQYILDNGKFFPENVNLDRIYFYNPESYYISNTPTALWLKPFMITDVLQKPINDQIELQRPLNYVDIFEYDKNLKTNKKEKSSSDSKK
ncbi:snurportin-1-like [Sipha flava]|uniref:Snurportin-1 n=1 Tax=Sipha flava TaxID=143950 RepID=A0A8B8GFX2_9HEMI|nr:snurportin-1-like [Sipha flava]